MAVGMADRLEGAPWWAPLLDGLGEDHMDAVAYDTAWLARVRTAAGRRLAFPDAWTWLAAHQHPDGSWGGEVPFLPDRLAATLAAVVALAEGERDGVRRVPPGVLASGLRALRSLTERYGSAPPPVETVGFELCVPALLGEARGLGLDVPAGMTELERRRQAKLSRLPEGWRRNPPGSLLHSLEGWVGAQAPDACLDAVGSCGNSPSATACLQRLAPSAAAMAYLGRAVVAGGAKDVDPFEVFEIAWVLDHLALAGVALPTSECGPLCARLRAAGRPGGWGISAVGVEPDADDTALALLALRRCRQAADARVLDAFERDEGFACFPFERGASVSANIHVAYAALRLNHPRASAVVSKVADYLGAVRTSEGFWTDKWHLSPLYPTGRAVVALHAARPDLVAPAVRWLRESQRPDGSWGQWGGSPEETAYAVQALHAAGAAEPQAMARAAVYLAGSPARPALWIGKGLYCPRRVVDAAVGSALSISGRWTS